MLRAECIVGWQWTCQQWLDPVGKTEGKLNTVYIKKVGIQIRLDDRNT